MSKGLKVFITYAHKNSEAKDKLITYLAVMKQNGLIDVWHDNEILPGDKWRDEIFNNLADSDILLYLTCAHSLASENCNKELTAALNPNIRVIPIILEHCDWKNHQLSDFQALPEKGKPIYDISEWNPESKGWMSVVEGLRKVVNEIQNQPKSAPRITPEEIETLASLTFQRGNFLLMLKHIDEALNAYSRVIELNPSYANAYNNRGVAHDEKGELDCAIEDYNKTIQLEPDHVSAYYNRGTAYGKKNEVDRALKDFNKAIERYARIAEVYTNRGNVYYNKGDFNRALEDYNKAIKLKPNLTEAYIGRGNVYSEKDEIDSAIKDYTQAIRGNPKYALAYSKRGDVYLEKGELELAIADYTEAMRLDSNDANLYITRGFTYARKDDLDLAIKDFNKAIELKPDLIERRNSMYALAYRKRGAIYFKKGDFDIAISDYTEAIHFDSNDANLYVTRGLTYACKGKYDFALKDFDKAIQINPNDVEPYYFRIIVLLELRNWREVKTDLTLARGKGIDITTLFLNNYENIEDFEQKHGIKLPEDIAAMLTSA